ncbi:MAG: transcription antitermination protein NusB [uncultured bacterium]|nr:MAG: transcription antitermination protein NusB [uncultured bacterium]
MNPKARRHARQYALQAMYQWQIAGTPINEIEFEFLAHQIKQKTDIAYFKELIHAIPSDPETLDQHMLSFLSRPIAELDPVELAILRLSIYELAHRLDIPYRVVINEALELTKKFGSVEGYKFVNGVLDQVARTLRRDEIKADQKS